MTVYKDVELINNFLEKVPADFFLGCIFTLIKNQI